MPASAMELAVLTAILVVQTGDAVEIFCAIPEHIKVPLAHLVADFLTRLPYTSLTSKIVDRCITVIDRASEGGADDSGNSLWLRQPGKQAPSSTA